MTDYIETIKNNSRTQKDTELKIDKFETNDKPHNFIKAKMPLSKGEFMEKQRNYWEKPLKIWLKDIKLEDNKLTFLLIKWNFRKKNSIHMEQIILSEITLKNQKEQEKDLKNSLTIFTLLLVAHLFVYLPFVY